MKILEDLIAMLNTKRKLMIVSLLVGFVIGIVMCYFITRQPGFDYLIFKAGELHGQRQ